MEASRETKKRRGFFGRNRLIIGLLVISVLVAGVLITSQIVKNNNEARNQRNAISFYKAPKGWSSQAQGTLLRSERVYLPALHAKAWRILYVSKNFAGYPTISSGMVFAPLSPGIERPVVAYAHGSLGLGSQCAPSRKSKPLGASGWLQEMIDRGWVVTATDYAGLGTRGASSFLVGQDEAHDMWNSVAAAHGLPSGAGTNVVLLGHSQGGHAALWSAQLGHRYAPDLNLRGVVALAPPTELSSLLSHKWNQASSWDLGPDIVEAWPAVYPLDLGSALTLNGRRVWHRLSRTCSSTPDEFLQKGSQRFFLRDPVGLPSWKMALQSQSVPLLSPDIPVLLEQGLRDNVVLAITTKEFVNKQCAAGAMLQTQWRPSATHLSIMRESQEQFMQWIAERFAGKAASSNCSTPLPHLARLS